MDEREDLRSLFELLKKGLNEIYHNVIRSGQEIRESIARILNGGGISSGSCHEGRRVYGETIFSKTETYN